MLSRVLTGLRWLGAGILHWLDIRKRHWLLAAAVFYGLLFFGVMTTKVATQTHSQLIVKDLQIAAIKRADKEHYAMTKTIQVAYGMSEPAADFYAYIYKRAAAKHVLPWAALAATTKIESGFDPAAKSPAGACGLMQLLEPTAADHCKKLGIVYRKNVTVWNPAVNLYLGASYFNMCYRNGIEDPQLRLAEAIKRYLGGSKYRDYSKQDIIAKYCQDVLQEYEKLNYIYIGVLTTYK